MIYAMNPNVATHIAGPEARKAARDAAGPLLTLMEGAKPTDIASQGRGRKVLQPPWRLSGIEGGVSPSPARVVRQGEALLWPRSMLANHPDKRSLYK